MARYRGRVSGPLLERLDLFVPVPVETKRVERLWQTGSPEREATATVRSRADAARAFARYTGRTALNARLEGEALRRHASLTAGAEQLLRQAASKWALSARAVHRTLRVARTVADLAGSLTMETDAVAEALSFRHEVSRS